MHNAQQLGIGAIIHSRECPQIRVPPAALGAGGVGRVGGRRERRGQRARDAAAGRRGPARLARAAPLRPRGAPARARARLVGEAGWCPALTTASAALRSANAQLRAT